MPESFTLSTSDPSRVVRTTLARTLSEADVGLLFLSGRLTQHATAIATALAEGQPRSTWVTACGLGALTEDGEFEGEDAACGMILDCPSSVLVSASPDREFGERLRDALRLQPRCSAQLFLEGDPTQDGWLDPLNRAEASLSSRVSGAGLLPHSRVLVSRGAKVKPAGALALLPGAPLLSRSFSTSACRLISPLVEITRAQQGAVFELDGAPALDRLSEHASSITDGSLLLVAIAGSEDALSSQGRTLALRGIEGVDPTKGSLLLGEGFECGARIAFAVRDAHAARRDLQNHLRALTRSGAGTAPLWGFYTCSAGRGHPLYGSASVESRLIRAAFPQMPLLGIKSSFEVAPIDGRLIPQVLTGIFTCFSQPS